MISTPLIIWLAVAPPLLVVLFYKLFLTSNRFDKLAMRSARPKSYLIGLAFGTGLAMVGFCAIAVQLHEFGTSAASRWSSVGVLIVCACLILAGWGTIKRRRVFVGIAVAICWCLLFAQITLYAFSGLFGQDNQTNIVVSLVVFLQAVFVTYYFRSRWWEFHPYPWPKLANNIPE